jgi:hypothetical protein
MECGRCCAALDGAGGLGLRGPHPITNALENCAAAQYSKTLARSRGRHFGANND